MGAYVGAPTRTAAVIPFPMRARRAQIAKTAAYMASLGRDHAEAHLREQVRRQRASLEKKGVAEPLIRAELASYEGSVRAALWRALLTGGGAA